MHYHLYDKEAADEKSDYSNKSGFNIIMVITAAFILGGLLPILIEYINIKALVVGLLSFIVLDTFNVISIRS